MSQTTYTTTKNTKYTKYTKKLSHSATIASSLFLLPAGTQAAIIQSSSSLTISNDNLKEKIPVITTEQGLVSGRSYISSVDWDIDGNSVADFQLQARSSTFKFSLHSTFAYAPAPRHFEHTGGTSGLSFVNLDPSNQGIVQSKETFNFSLPLGERVRPNLNDTLAWTNFNKTPSSNLSEYFIGFNFLDDTNQVLYGWAEINSNLSQLTIKQWAYEDNGNSIKVGEGRIGLPKPVAPVPLPPSALLFLSGLAMGAGGILRGRKNRTITKNKLEHTE